MADDFSSSLGFDATEAIASIQKLARELERYSTSMTSTADATKEFNRLQITADRVLASVGAAAVQSASRLRALAKAQQEAAASAQNFAAQQTRAESANARFQKSIGLSATAKPILSGDQIGAAAQQRNTEILRRLEGNLRSVGRQAQQTGQQIQQGAEQGAKGAQSLELSWRSVIRVFGIQFVARAMASIVSSFTEGISAAREFEISLAEIQTISKEFASGSINEVGRVVQNLSTQFGRPIEDVAAGLYQTLSNQIGNATESTRFLTEALEFSVAAVTTTEEAVDLLSGVLNAYNLNAESAARISDELFKTIELGRVKGSELANSFGRVTTLAAQLGISTSEVGASIAELTIQGVKANDAMTQLTNVFLKLVQPSDNLKARFQELGIASAEAGIAAFGLNGFLVKLTEGGKTLSEISDLLGGRIRAIRGTGSLVNNAERLNETLKEITDSAGAAQKAFETINKTNAQELTRTLTEVRNILVNEIGRNAIKVFNDLVSAVGGARNAFKLLGGAITIVVGTGILIFLKTMTVEIGKFAFATDLAAKKTFLLNKGLLLLAGSAVALSFMLKFTDATEQASLALDKLQKQADEEIELKIKDAGPEIRKQQQAVTETTQRILDGLFEQRRAILETQEATIRGNRALTEDTFRTVKTQADAIKVGVRELEKIIDSAKSRSESVIQSVESLLRDISSGQFERAQKGLSPQAESRNRLEEANRLQSEAFRLSTQQDEDAQKRALDLLGEAKTQLEKVADLTGNTRFSQEALNGLRNNALKVEANILRTINDQKKAAEEGLSKNDEAIAKLAEVDKQQNVVAESQKQIQTAIENTTTAGIKFGVEFTKSLDAVGKAADALKTNLEQVQGRVQNKELLQQFRVRTEDLEQTPELAQAGAEVDAVAKIRKAALDAIQNNDIKALTDLRVQLNQQLTQIDQGLAERTSLQTFFEGYFGSSGEAVRNATQVLSTELKKAEDAIIGIKRVEAEKLDLTNQITQLEALGTTAGTQNPVIQATAEALTAAGQGSQQLGTGLGSVSANSGPAAAGIQSVQGVVNSFSTQRIVSEVQRAIEALQALAAARGAAGLSTGGIAVGFAKGGFVRHFASGSLARGTDTIPAMLSPGEFVVNAASTRKFFSQLVAINSGQKPIFRADGGPVSNTFGDINITVDSSTPVNARQLANELRRELRKKTTRLS